MLAGSAPRGDTGAYRGRCVPATDVPRAIVVKRRMPTTPQGLRHSIVQSRPHVRHLAVPRRRCRRPAPERAVRIVRLHPVRQFSRRSFCGGSTRASLMYVYYSALVGLSSAPTIVLQRRAGATHRRLAPPRPWQHGARPRPSGTCGCPPGAARRPSCNGSSLPSRRCPRCGARGQPR